MMTNNKNNSKSITTITNYIETHRKDRKKINSNKINNSLNSRKTNHRKRMNMTYKKYRNSSDIS